MINRLAAFINRPFPSCCAPHHESEAKCKKCCPQYFKNYFTFDKSIHVHTTQQSILLHLPTVRAEEAKRSFHYHGCVIFNKFNYK